MSVRKMESSSTAPSEMTRGWGLVLILAGLTTMVTAKNQKRCQTIEIDKGASSGVLTGMPVVGAGGLVGIVTATTSGGATVTLLTDASQSIGVTFAGNEAVVHGQGPSRTLDTDFVAPGTPVHIGETMYTSGLQGGLFPPGIPVGKIAGAQTHRGATELSISVKPLANLSQLAYVDVVLWEPGS